MSVAKVLVISMQSFDDLIDFRFCSRHFCIAIIFTSFLGNIGNFLNIMIGTKRFMSLLEFIQVKF